MSSGETAEPIVETTGRIFRIQRFSTEDGPGIRTTVFLKGCPLSCWWCHNPEGLREQADLMYNPTLCVRCGACEIACSFNVHSFPNGEHMVNRGACTFCGACEPVCPTGALAVTGKDLTVGHAMDVVEKDAAYFASTGGGLTISGGEPLLQPEFSRALRQKAAERGVGVYIETSGYSSSRDFLRVMEGAQGILFDLKQLDPVKHREATGMDNGAILDNFRLAVSLPAKLVVRIPLIPGFNDSDTDLRETAAFLNSCNFKGAVEILPYHRLGLTKYRNYGVGTSANQPKPPDAGTLTHVSELLSSLGLSMIRR